MSRSPLIGVLALQGNFREHGAMLRRLGAEVVEVRKAEQVDGLDGLVIPGGESSTFMHLMRLYGLDEAVRTFGGPMLGTCAGMIVLDRDHPVVRKHLVAICSRVSNHDQRGRNGDSPH